MNKAPQIIFNEDGTIKLDTTATVEGFAATVQNALVNLLLDQGKDKLFPERGTQLLTRSIAGGIVNMRAAEHQANFAASDTLFFSREHETADTNDKLQDVQLTPRELSLLRLDLAATFVAVDGRVISFPITSPTF